MKAEDLHLISWRAQSDVLEQNIAEHLGHHISRTYRHVTLRRRAI